MSLAKRHSFLFPSFVTLVTLFITAVLMVIYLCGELRGNPDWLILPSAQYEMPDVLKAKGLEPLYLPKDKSGWDGQFYYEIANDIFARTDAKEKVELAPYRYQRIGISLLSKVASIILGYDYVPVFVFYLTSVFLVAAAGFVFAAFLQRRGYSPFLALLWTLASGTQMTVMNGLPDAGADALLLMALMALFSGKRWFYSVTILVSILSREIYVLVPISVLLAEFWRYRKSSLSREAWRAFIMSGFPVFLFGAWHLYLYVHFADMPSVDIVKEGLVSFVPLASWGGFLLKLFAGGHPRFDPGMTSFFEAANLLSFLVLIAACFWFLLRLFCRQSMQLLTDNVVYIRPVSISFLLVLSVYLFLGDTVMGHYTGYLKTISVCFAIIILCRVWCRKKISRALLTLLFFCFAVPQATLFLRVSALPSTQVQYSRIYAKEVDAKSVPLSTTCLSDLRYKLQFMKKENFYKNPFFSHLFGRREFYVLRVRVKNTSAQSWPVARTVGSIKLIAYWRTRETNLLVPAYTWPTMLQTPLNPGEERFMPLVIHVPSRMEKKKLTIKIIQQGCGDFLTIKDPNALDIMWD